MKYSRILLSLGLGAAVMATPMLCLAQPAPVDTHDGMAMATSSEEGGYAQEALFLGAEIINLCAILAGILLLALAIGRYGASDLSRIFSLFMLATALLGACRFFIFLTLAGVFHVQDETMSIGWHIIFYMAMITFILAAKNLVQLGTTGESGMSQKKIVGWGVFTVVVTVALFLTVQIYDPLYMRYTEGSLWEIWGGMHFIAGTLAAIAAFYVFQRAKLGSITKVIATPLLIAIGLFAIQHSWELCTESWKIIAVPSELIEKIELLFVVPAYLLVAFAFWRLWKLTTKTQSA